VKSSFDQPFGRGAIVNLIWDFDGTIFDTYPRILNAFDAIVNGKYHLNVSSTRMEDLVFVDTKHCARVISEEHTLDADALLSEIRAYYDHHGSEETLLPGIKALITRNDHRKHFLVTHRDRASLMKRLEQAELQGRFLEIITKDDSFKEKPDPESFEYLISKFGLKRGDTMGIGDRDIDVGAARSAGIKAVLISKREDVDADFRIDTTEDLAALLDQFS